MKALLASTVSALSLLADDAGFPDIQATALNAAISGSIFAVPTLEGRPPIAKRSPSLYDPPQSRAELPVARGQRKLAAILAAEVVGYSPAHELAESGTKELGTGTRYGGRGPSLPATAPWLASLEIAHVAQLFAPPMP